MYSEVMEENAAMKVVSVQFFKLSQARSVVWYCPKGQNPSKSNADRLEIFSNNFRTSFVLLDKLAEEAEQQQDGKG